MEEIICLKLFIFENTSNTGKFIFFETDNSTVRESSFVLHDFKFFILFNRTSGSISKQPGYNRIKYWVIDLVEAIIS